MNERERVIREVFDRDSDRILSDLHHPNAAPTDGYTKWHFETTERPRRVVFRRDGDQIVGVYRGHSCVVGTSVR